MNRTYRRAIGGILLVGCAACTATPDGPASDATTARPDDGIAVITTQTGDTVTAVATDFEGRELSRVSAGQSSTAWSDARGQHGVIGRRLTSAVCEAAARVIARPQPVVPRDANEAKDDVGYGCSSRASTVTRTCLLIVTACDTSGGYTVSYDTWGDC